MLRHLSCAPLYHPISREGAAFSNQHTMKTRLLWLVVLSLLLSSANTFAQGPSVSGTPEADRTEHVAFGDIYVPSLTTINFDDIIFSNDNSIEISPNRYSGVSFYSLFASTWLTWNRRHSVPNSLIVGRLVPYPDPQGNSPIISSESMVIEFSQPSKDVAFLWGTDSYYSGGFIEIYENNNHLVSSFPVTIGFANWLPVTLNGVSERIRKVVLRRPQASFPAGFGHIFVDNLQFTPNPSTSPVGALETVSTTGSVGAFGWSADPDNPTASNSVSCYVDGPSGQGRFIGTVPANYSGPGAPYPGNHRFAMPIPADLRDGNQHRMYCYGNDVTGGDSPTLLAGSPKTFKFNLPIGWLDSAPSLNEEGPESESGGNTVGWSLDPDVPTRSNIVHFYVDGPAGVGTYIGGVEANIPRPDVNTSTGYPGAHGFSFPIPAQYRDGSQHSIYAYGLDLSGDPPKLLQGSPKTFSLLPTIYSVTFEPVNSALDRNPNAGEGQRIFPDSQNPGESVNRRRVLVKATISPARPNVAVYLKSYDLDDPSTDEAPVDTNGSQGNDNRGDAGTPQSAGILEVAGSNCTLELQGLKCLTDAAGTVSIEFTTTMHPGDNFAVAASTLPAYLNGIVVSGIDLADSSGNVISQSPFSMPARAKRTEMLTVWRRLHLEVDSMGNVGEVNKVTGTVVANGSKLAPGEHDIQVVTASPLEVNRFSNGRVDIGGNPFRVKGNGAGSIRIIVEATVRIQNGTPFTLYDDDDYNADDSGYQDGDRNEPVVQLPNSFKLLSDNPLGDTFRDRNVFGVAYILPEYHWAYARQYNQTNLQFELNVEAGVNGATIINVLDRNRDSKNDERDDFWVAYVLVGYQGPLLKDFDGLDPTGTTQEGAWLGAAASPFVTSSEIPVCDCYKSSNCPTGGIRCALPNGTPVMPVGRMGALVFEETLQDFKNYFLSPPPGITPRAIEEVKLTIPHEVGHQFGLLGDDWRPTFKLMDYSSYLRNVINEEVFHPEHINIMRWRVKSPGR